MSTTNVSSAGRTRQADKKEERKKKQRRSGGIGARGTTLWQRR